MVYRMGRWQYDRVQHLLILACAYPDCGRRLLSASGNHPPDAVPAKASVIFLDFIYRDRWNDRLWSIAPHDEQRRAAILRHMENPPPGVSVYRDGETIQAIGQLQTYYVGTLVTPWYRLESKAQAVPYRRIRRVKCPERCCGRITEVPHW